MSSRQESPSIIHDNPHEIPHPSRPAPARRSCSPLLLAAPAFADTFGSGANPFTMDFVTIGNAGNLADDTGYGSVGYTYRMGVNEVSRGMIDAYNALIPGHGGPTLTMSDMTSNGGNGANRPASGVSWNEAARFVNWLNTSQGFSAAYNFTTTGSNNNITLWTISESHRDSGSKPGVGTTPGMRREDGSTLKGLRSGGRQKSSRPCGTPLAFDFDTGPNPRVVPTLGWDAVSRWDTECGRMVGGWAKSLNSTNGAKVRS